MGKFMARIRNFDSFGAVIPTFWPNRRESWYPHAKFHVCRGLGATCRPCGGAKNLLLDY